MSNASGTRNAAVGCQALLNNTNSDNTATGYQALFSNTIGAQNTANGAVALANNTTGNENTATGASALLFNTGGSNNTASGFHALLSNETGIRNTAAGSGALNGNTIGGENTAIGDSALSSNVSGNFNTAVGLDAGADVTTAHDVICIGAGVAGANVDNSCYINSICGQPVDPATATAVAIDINGKLGTTVSSGRFKHDIKAMDKSSEAVLALRPVTFHYKSDTKDTPCFGLIAEEVAQVNPNLVLRDKSGEILTVRYDQVNAMLLNEFLKEHKKVEEQQSKMEKQEATITVLESKVAKEEETIAQQQTEMRTVMARLNEQGAQIQKVSAQVETSRSVTKVAVTSQ